MGVAKFVEIKLKISSSSFADSKNKPHVACEAYEIMGLHSVNAVLQYDFTSLR